MSQVIEYFDVEVVERQSFASYRAEDYFAHSSLKREVNGVVPHLERTSNMEFGQAVDEILTEPGNADLSSPWYSEAKKVAHQIKGRFGRILSRMKGQLSYYGKARFGRFVLPVKGRPDLVLPGFMVVDLKWTNTKAKDLPKLIEFMGYRNQLWHYCRLAGVSQGYLLFYCHPDRETVSIPFDFSEELYNPFYAEKIQKFGKVA